MGSGLTSLPLIISSEKKHTLKNAILYKLRLEAKVKENFLEKKGTSFLFSRGIPQFFSSPFGKLFDYSIKEHLFKNKQAEAAGSSKATKQLSPLSLSLTGRLSQALHKRERETRKIKEAILGQRLEGRIRKRKKGG